MAYAVIGGVVLVLLLLALFVFMRARAGSSVPSGRAAQPAATPRRAEPGRVAPPPARAEPLRKPVAPPARTTAPPAIAPRPAATPRPAPGTPARQAPANSAVAPTVLIVDDSPVMRRSLISLFDKGGYRTASAESGDAAVAWVRGHGMPGFMTLDMEMPGMDGLQTLDALQALGAAGVMRAVFVTSKVQSERVREVAAGKGVVGFFNKPFDSAALLGMAQRVAPLANSAPR